jgi:hypothetical protein
VRAAADWHTHFDTLDGKPVFRIADPVYLSQKDIRQVQLAKAAVHAGTELMLAANGLTPGRVDRVPIAGSFGFHLRTGSLLNLGLLPREFAGRVEFVGNTSKTGARAFLLNRRLCDDLAALVRRVRVLELANDPAFEKPFVNALSFDVTEGGSLRPDLKKNERHPHPAPALRRLQRRPIPVLWPPFTAARARPPPPPTASPASPSSVTPPSAWSAARSVSSAARPPPSGRTWPTPAPTASPSTTPPASPKPRPPPVTASA